MSRLSPILQLRELRGNQPKGGPVNTQDWEREQTTLVLSHWQHRSDTECFPNKPAQFIPVFKTSVAS